MNAIQSFKLIGFSIFAHFILITPVVSGQLSDEEIEEKINKLMARMTLEEKAAMLAGDTTSFDSKPIERLGIPVLRMTDGPVGVRWGKSTAFPASICMAATWNPALVYETGQALGRETRAKGRNVLLAPCVNIHRTPQGGRNFESFGEDPYLAGQMAAAYVRGVQSERVIATVKHFACNNQEYERNSIDVKIDERTLHEIYLPAFKAAVQEGGVWAVMSAYNRVNGHYCSSSTTLLTDILKKRWGFKGFVMSDWGAVHSVVPCLYAGMDIEMPRDRYFTVENVIRALRGELMKPEKIDDKVRRMLRAMYHMDFFNTPETDTGALGTTEHRDIALKVAQEGMVLLKNNNHILPLQTDKIRSIAVIGPLAGHLSHGGGGSSRVNPLQTVSPIEGLKNSAGEEIEIHYEPGSFSVSNFLPVPKEALVPPAGHSEKHGLLGRYYANAHFQGKPVREQIDPTIAFDWDIRGPEGMDGDFFSVIWEGKLVAPETGMYAIAAGSDDGIRLYIDGELKIDNWGRHAVLFKHTTLEMKQNKPVDIRIEYNEISGSAGAFLNWQKTGADPLQDAMALAEQSDVTLLFVGNTADDETEGKDRETLALPEYQKRLVQAVSEVSPKTVLVLTCGAGLIMNPWLEKVDAVLLTWFPGQEGGQAIADILLGHVNPSGKLTTTFFKRWEDCPSYGQYPGENGEVSYCEGVFTGYRHFDTNDIDPLFPFGYGLSYTDFKYSDLVLSNKTVSQGESITVHCIVENTGTVDGAEVVQLYIGDKEAGVPRPEKELKGFEKVFLRAGEAKKITLTVKPEDLAYYDIAIQDWKTEPGKFYVYIGSSSRDIRLKGSFILK